MHSRVRRRNPRYHTHPSLVRYMCNYLPLILTECLQLVTKPFGSTSGLSRPFRPPSFVRPQVGLVQSAPIPAPAEELQFAAAEKELPVNLELPEHSEDETGETEYRECTLLRNLFIRLSSHYV